MIVSEVITMKQIGKHIKKLRMEQGMTQDQLAQALNVTRQAVSNWETGKTQPSIETLTAIAGLFGITVEELIYGRSGRAEFPPFKPTGTGIMFGGLFLLFMTIFLLFPGILFGNAWGIMIGLSVTLSAVFTALMRLQEQIDALSARIGQLEKNA